MVYKYSLAADFIKQKILAGIYKPGEKLPSIQTLSKELSSSCDTIIKAYKQLEKEHLIYVMSKSGYYVVKSAVTAGKRTGIMDMVSASPPDRINPYIDFCHCMDKAVEIYERKLFEYSSPQGLPELVAILVKHMAGFQVFTKAWNIFITNGSQQALYILGAMPFPNNGKTVLVEQPTYPIMLEVMKFTGTPVAGIRRTEEGIDLKELEEIFKSGDIKFFYTMPRYQNPTGFSYSNTQKKEIARLAGKYGVYIVEDDYLADLELDKKTDPMYGSGDEDIMIYIRSFSKTLLPGVRLGMAILPPKLQEAFICLKRSIDLNSPVLTQGALEIYLKSNMYKFHVQKTKKYYREKMDVLRKAFRPLKDYEIKCFIPETGIYAYIELKDIEADILVKRLSKRNVIIRSTQNSYINGFDHPEGLSLCVCKATNEDIARVADCIKEELSAVSLRKR